MASDKNTRKFIITSVVALIPELAFSWILAKIFETSIWYAWISIQIIKIVIWLINTSIEYVLFHLLWKKDIIDSISSSLALYNYPNPTKYTSSALADDFFYDVMMDDELDIKTRLDAAQTHSVISNTGSTQGFLRAIRTDNIFAEAIRKYHSIKFSGKKYDTDHL